MSLSICADCLSQLRISSKTTTAVASGIIQTPQSFAFHSSAARYANPVKKKTGPRPEVRHRQALSMRMKKKGKDRPKPPPIGERRAQRQRIVLSNTNAIAVSDLQNWSKENMVDPACAGQVLGLDGALLDQLRDSKAFKRTQNWSLFRRPATLIRSETLKIGQDIQKLSNSPSPTTVKHLVIGEKASGKSTLMLQTMCMAFMNNWVVINVPEAKDFVNNTSSYAPVKEGGAEHATSEQLYIHPHLTQALLTRAMYSNEAVLKTLKLNHPVPKEFSLKPHATLKDLAQVAVEDHTLAWPVWQAFWRELHEPGTKPRPPVLLTVDGFDHWMGPTKYRSAEFKIIHAHQFTLIRQFTNLLFSNNDAALPSPLANGGLMFFCTSGSNTPAYPTFTVLLNQMQARAKGISPTSPDFPLPAPYSKADPYVMDLMPRTEGIKLLDLNGSSVLESKGLLEYFVRSGVLQTTLTEAAIAEYRGLSNGGIMGELAKLGRRIRV
ncbi:uncharacterized protein Z518_05039 [Rhinocladiella mackenziei CBS 650.93]|uniref:Small ribosomal subunit protein mS29 n=1 Tax=Rhinocladiella mackenziei CBS 650.93 TaxID=1442369 RepID=A0A0D2FXP9_9EURO|nr:uncharacterized protein Z518_05039 [Rhinocladiella mackenziei CBS 650.93]KIX07062.1 hypothetical protein Z518_05039 [Rhinocladiella mackenziei CBS 650.93]